MWTRFEFNQREESPGLGGIVSSPWLFGTLGAERVVAGGETSGLQVGFFGEGTWGYIPEALQAFYGASSAVTVNVGLHLFGMWMLDGDLPSHAPHDVTAPAPPPRVARGGDALK